MKWAIVECLYTGKPMPVRFYQKVVTDSLDYVGMDAANKIHKAYKGRKITAIRVCGVYTDERRPLFPEWGP